MKAGRVASFNAIELRCKYVVDSGSASVDDPANYGAAYGGQAGGFSEYSTNPLREILAGIETSISTLNLTSGNHTSTARFKINALSIDESADTLTFKATQESIVRLEGVKLYVEGFPGRGIEYWTLQMSKIEWRVDGVLEFTDASPADITSEFSIPRLTPNTIPLLATPWTVTGKAVAIGPGQVKIGPNNPIGDADATVTITGGWRIDDGSGLEALPVSFKSLAEPDLACDFPTPSFVEITVTDTDDMSFVSESTDVTIDLGPQSQVTAIGNFGRLTLLPNLPSAIFRMNDDYDALWVRGALPSAGARSTHVCSDFVIPPVKTSATANEDFLIERSEFLAHVDNDVSPIEDVLGLTVFAPYRLEGAGVINGTGVPADDGSNTISSEYPVTMSSPNGRFRALEQEQNVINRYVGYWGHRHWSFFMQMEDWVGGDPKTYWGQLRQQWMDNAALPLDENTQTRNFMMTEPMQEGGLAFNIEQLWLTVESSWVGISRFITGKCLSGSGLRIVLDSASQNEWSLDIDEDSNPDDAVAVFGSSITLQPLSGSSPTRTIQYDMAQFDNAPFMTAHHAFEINVGWSLTNVVSVKVELVGKDDSLVVLSGDGTQGDIPWPLTGTASEFAGTWIQDYLNGPGADEAGGASAATIADPERNFAFQYLPGKTAEWLRFTFTVVDPMLAVTLEYAEFLVADVATPIISPTKVLHETAQVAIVVRDRGPGTRFGQWTFWDYDGTDSYITTPLVRDPADQSSILDVLGYRNVAWRAIAPDSGLDAELATLFDLGKEYDVRGEFARDAIGLARDTHGFLFDGGFSSPVYVLVSSLREVPPLVGFPGRRRVADLWEPDGIYELGTYSLCQGKRQYVSAHDPTDIQEQAGGEIWTNAESFLVGWELHEHDHITTNVEGDFDYLGRLVKKGEGEPYHGGFAIFDSKEGNHPANYEMPEGHYLRANSVEGDIEVWAVNWTAPDGGFDTQDIVTTTGNDVYPSLGHDHIAHAVWLVFEREDPANTFTIKRGISDDQAVSFNALTTVISNARYPRLAIAPNGTIIIAAFRYDSGSSGPGTIVAKRQLPGDAALSGEFTFQSGGGDLAVDDEIIDLIKIPGIEDRWVLLVQPSGSSDLKLYESFDECATFDDLGTVLTNAKNPRLAAAPNGTLVVSGFRYDSGSSGPGTIVAKRQLPGDTALSGEFTLQQNGGDLSVADEVFDLVKVSGIEDRWIFVARASGSSDLKEYQSFDECASFEDI